MTTQTETRGSAAASVGSLIAVALIGLTLMIVAGHVQAAALHDAAHDVRHATGFPCH